MSKTDSDPICDAPTCTDPADYVEPVEPNLSVEGTRELTVCHTHVDPTKDDVERV